MTYQRSTASILQQRVVDNLIEMRNLLNKPKNQITRYILNRINSKNDSLRYYLEPVNSPIELNFVDLKLVNTLLGSPIELSKLIKGQTDLDKIDVWSEETPALITRADYKKLN